MLPWMAGVVANPSGSHAPARAARAALDGARDQIAARLGARPSEVVFTSGGTEALNTAVLGRLVPGEVVTLVMSAVEHAAVRETAFAAERAGWARVLEAPVGADGVLDLDALDLLLAGAPAPVRLVAVMAVNNEVGTIQPVADAAAIVRRRCPDAALPVDAVCSSLWCDLSTLLAPADLAVVSAHKLGGPQGTGVLVVREGTALAPLLRGGGQEADRRSGTQHVAGAVGFAAALDLAQDEWADVAARVGALRDRLVDGLVAALPGVTETGDRARKIANNAHVCIEGVESEALLVLLDRAGVCASAGSACASGALHASHVLLAMGVPKERALGSLRLTLGPSTTADDVAEAHAAIVRAVEQLRS